MPLPSNTLAELQRDMARLGFVVSQIRENRGSSLVAFLARRRSARRLLLASRKAALQFSPGLVRVKGVPAGLKSRRPA
jgi:hypothetical protein